MKIIEKKVEKINRQEIMDACTFLAENATHCDPNTISFIKDASLTIFDSLAEDFCKKYENNGQQMLYPGNCTGCGSNGEKRIFVLKTKNS